MNDSTTDPALAPAPASLLSRLATPAARDGLVVLFAQGSGTLLALVVDVILFRNLPQADRGTLSATLGLQAVLVVLADLGLSLTTIRVGAKYLGAGQAAQAATVFRLALKARILLGLVVAGAAVVLAPVLAAAPLASPGHPGLIWAATLAVLGTSLVSWGIDLAQTCRRFGFYALLQIGNAFVKAIAIGALLLLHTPAGPELDRLAGVPLEQIVWLLGGASLLAGLLSVALGLRLIPAGATNDAERAALVGELRSFNRYAVALVVLSGLSGYVEVLLLQMLLTPTDTAVFDGARRFAMLLPLLTTALTTVLLPRAAALDGLAASRAYVGKALRICVPLALVTAGGLAAIAPWVLPGVFGAKYAPAVPILQILCLGYAFGIFMNPVTLVLYPLKREAVFVYVNALHLVLALAVGAVLIQSSGAVGAAWSVVIVKTVISLAYLPALWKALGPAATNEP